MNWTLFLWLCLASCLHLVSAQDYTCSATKPCALGCCSSTGVCGLGPDFCGETCISNCDRKSECNPGWGMKWSQADSCPLNVCCSKFGFCGMTKDFCGNKTVQAPQCSGGSSSSKRTIGYYEGWSVTRQCDRMYPESLPIGSYTHLNFAFAFIDPVSFKVAPMNPGDERLYRRFTGLKNLYPSLETWISIGGWSMNDADQPTATTFSDLAGSADAQAKFFDSLISFMETYGFDGVDIDWEYPVAEERSGRPADYQNFPSFLKNLRKALSSTGHKYGLTITIPSSYWYLQHFDVVEIEKTIDWFNVMSYDLHGTWDSQNRFTGPYLKAHTNLTEINQALELLWRNDINPEHVVLGLGFYGRSFTLTDPSCTKPGCTFSSGGNAGPCTAAVGTLSFAEIEKIIADGAHVELDADAGVKIVTWGGNQWVSYDDAQTLKLKLDYANSRCLGGTMVWAASTDDAQGSAAAALSRLTGRSAIAMAMSSTSSTDQVQSCRLGECGQPCPSGLKPAQRSDGKNKGNTGTNTGCRAGQSRLYCCPPDNMPTCQWRGTAPFCKGKCHAGEVEVSSSTSGTGHECFTGHKALCCTQNAANAAVAECKWSGSAPFCAKPFGTAGCPSGRQALTHSNYGAGGEQPCVTGMKSFCCDQPPPYEKCDWYYHGGKILKQIPFVCTGECPAGKASIATDPSGCLSGYGSFCCDSPATTNDPLVASFTQRLEKFVKNPVCKPNDRQFTKRDEGNTSVSLAKRHDLISSDWSGLMHQITALAIGRTGTYQASLMTGHFNTTYGEPFGLSLDQIHRSFDDAPLVDTTSRTESLMCMGRNAGNQVDDYERTRSNLCVLPCASARSKRDVDESLLESNGTKLFFARNIDESEASYPGTDTDLPTWGYIVNGIIEGRMTLVYEQLIHTNGGENILEIVWETPDRSYQETTADRWVVFHFHFEHLANRGGVNLAGIYAVVAFHGQQWASSRAYSRVDGNDHHGDNRRAHILQCNTGNQANRHTIYWYPGDLPDSATTGLPVWAQVMTRFGNYLYNQDLITEETFTGEQRGQLTTFTEPGDPCPRRYFDWGGYRQSRQFRPGNSQGDPSTEDSQADNDEV